VFMKAWLASLTPEDRQVARKMLARGYSLRWRDEVSGRESASPLETEKCWLEIRHGEELLTFLGPFQWPLSEALIRSTGVFMLRQVEQTMNKRRS